MLYAWRTLPGHSERWIWAGVALIVMSTVLRMRVAWVRRAFAFARQAALRLTFVRCCYKRIVYPPQSDIPTVFSSLLCTPSRSRPQANTFASPCFAIWGLDAPTLRAAVLRAAIMLFHCEDFLLFAMELRVYRAAWEMRSRGQAGAPQGGDDSARPEDEGSDVEKWSSLPQQGNDDDR